MASAGGHASFFPCLPWAGEQCPEGETLVLPLSRGSWLQNGMPVKWSDISPGAFHGGMLSGFNGLLTCALVHNLHVVLERVYDRGIVAWEQNNPGRVPEDDLCLGFYLHITGHFSDLVAYTSELVSLIGQAAHARTLISRRDPPPPLGSLLNLSEAQVS